MKENNFDNLKDGKLVIEFENKEAALHFKTWLCESGEQQYWNWMEQVEQQYKDGSITALNFDYWSDGNHIKIKCGRLDKK